MISMVGAPDMSNVEDFWQWALGQWSNPQLAAELLHLQDRHNCIVLELLLLVWLDQQDMSLSDVGYRRLVTVAACWNEEVVQPLRQTRIRWRDRADLEHHRARLKQLELTAEHALAQLYFGALKALAADDLSLRPAGRPNSNLELARHAASPPMSGSQVSTLLELMSA